MDGKEKRKNAGQAVAIGRPARTHVASRCRFAAQQWTRCFPRRVIRPGEAPGQSPESPGTNGSLIFDQFDHLVRSGRLDVE